MVQTDDTIKLQTPLCVYCFPWSWRPCLDEIGEFVSLDPRRHHEYVKMLAGENTALWTLAISFLSLSLSLSCSLVLPSPFWPILWCWGQEWWCISLGAKLDPNRSFFSTAFLLSFTHTHTHTRFVPVASALLKVGDSCASSAKRRKQKSVWERERAEARLPSLPRSPSRKVTPRQTLLLFLLFLSLIKIDRASLYICGQGCCAELDWDDLWYVAMWRCGGLVIAVLVFFRSRPSTPHLSLWRQTFPFDPRFSRHAPFFGSHASIHLTSPHLTSRVWTEDNRLIRIGSCICVCVYFFYILFWILSWGSLLWSLCNLERVEEQKGWYRRQLINNRDCLLMGP